MAIGIEIDTHDNQLIFDILGKTSAGRGDIIRIDENAVLIYRGSLKKLAVGLPETISFTLDIGKGIAIGVVATWLYNKIKNRSVKLRINRTEIEISEGEITRILREIIEEE